MSLPQEPFSHGDSLLHKADPRAKLVAAAALALGIAVGRSLPAAGLALGLGVLLVLLARLPLAALGKRLLAANLFVLFLWLVVPFSAPGEPLLSLGPLQASRQGILLALLVTLKCNAILLTLLALVASSPLPALGYAMQRLGLPVSLCWLLLFSYRYIFVIGQEYLRLSRAAHLRCFVPRNNLHTYRTVANLFGMTLVKSWNRAQRVRQAMLLRGFEGEFHLLTMPRLGRADLLLAAILSAAAVALLGLALSVPTM